MNTDESCRVVCQNSLNFEKKNIDFIPLLKLMINLTSPVFERKPQLLIAASIFELKSQFHFLTKVVVLTGVLVKK